MSTFAVFIEMRISKAHSALLLLMLLLGSVRSWAQDYPWLSHNNIMVEARGHVGLFWHHHFEMQKFNATYPAFEASIYQHTFGKKEWETVYEYPYIGATFYYADFGFNFEHNPEVGDALGSVYALYPFINYPLNANEYSQLTFKFGVGLGYLTKCFDNFDNYQNFSIGSHVNAAVNLSFEYRQRITSRLMSVASVGLTHFSNGSTKLPNYGLNTFSTALGLAYYLRPPRINLTPTRRPEYQPFEFDRKHWLSLDVDYAIGFKNVSQTLGGDSTAYYRVHDVSAYLLAQFTQYSRAGVGLSLVLDMSDQTLPDHFTDQDGIHIVKENPETHQQQVYDISTLQMTKLNFNLCYAMTMERLSYYFEFGWHLKYNLFTDLSKGNIYQKVTARYQLYDNIYAHVGLMTHFGRADYLCVGLGYRFNQKYYLNHEKGSRPHIPGMR